MCGRYKLTVPFSEIVKLYGVTNVSNLQPHYNIEPTQDIAGVRCHDHGRQLAMLRWGLIPARACRSLRRARLPSPIVISINLIGKL